MTIEVCFHGIGTIDREREPGESGYWVRRDDFLGMLDALKDAPEVRLSFDDGNRSDVDIALPALVDRGLHATFFPLAGRLADPASLHPDDLRALRAAGMRVGTHGWSHVSWRGLAEADAERELVVARDALSAAAGCPVTRAALPLGRYDRALLRRLRLAGYEAVYTSDRFHTDESAWLRARYSVTASDSADSVLALVHRRSRLREAVARGKSTIKRLR